MHHTASSSRVLALQPTGTRRRLLFMSLSLLMLVTALLASVTMAPVVSGQAATENETAADVAERVMDSAVTVYTWSPGGTWSPGQTGAEPTGAGSGWVYSEDGLVVTNAHVVAGTERVEIVTSGGSRIPAEVVGADWYQDVAVLRLQPGDGQELPPPATVGDSSQIRAGDEVIAIGTPLGQFANTVSVGIVGATGRALTTGTGYSLRNLIQHDASLSPGNSGGPLFSMGGELVGMNVAKVDGVTTGVANADDIGFAIDGNTVIGIVEELVANGTVARPYLGIQSQPTPEGQLVTTVEDGSPAAEAGVQPGDVITAIDGEVAGEERGFIDILFEREPGETVTLTVVRDGGEQEMEVTLGERPEGL